MKLKFVVILLVLSASALLFVTCRSNEKESQAKPIEAVIPDTVAVKTDAHYYWEVDANSPSGLSMKKTTPIPADSLSVDIMLQRFNQVYPEIMLQYSRVSNDTLFLKIKKASYLTQRMGSTGAAAYLAEVTYNFTELNAVNFVALSFKAGDHASPGIYSRTDFVK